MYNKLADFRENLEGIVNKNKFILTNFNIFYLDTIVLTVQSENKYKYKYDIEFRDNIGFYELKLNKDENYDILEGITAEMLENLVLIYEISKQISELLKD